MLSHSYPPSKQALPCYDKYIKNNQTLQELINETVIMMYKDVYCIKKQISYTPICFNFYILCFTNFLPATTATLPLASNARVISKIESAVLGFVISSALVLSVSSAGVVGS